MQLQQLFYVSRAREPYDSQVVQSILAQSRRNNRREDVTGCLLFSGQFFAQVLEGSVQAVSIAMERIRGDTRHSDFRLLVERPLTKRMYEEWSMAYLHSLELEDAVESLLVEGKVDAEGIVQVMDRMRPDTVGRTLT